MYLNRLNLIGFIGANAESKTGNAGSQFTVFSVATKTVVEERKRRLESRTERHRCLAFGKLGEFCGQPQKRAHVQVEGELRSREYGKDGVTDRTFECRVESILKLDRAARQESFDSADDVVS